MSIAIRRLRPVFVGEVSGVDVTKPLGPEEVGLGDVSNRVRRYDEWHPRDMRRTTVAGDAPTVT
jgi:hypothetical protein